jgi:cell division protein FtsA
VQAVVAAPYAAGLATLSEDEVELGATVIDCGAGTTTLASFVGGHCVHVDGIGLGGHHITMDLARGLSLRLSDAERLKTLHGSVIGTSSDHHDMITVPFGDDGYEGPDAVTRSRIVSVTKPRVEEILELLRERMKAAGVFGEPSRQIVLTGAGAELTGMLDLTSRMFDRAVRIGRPLGIAGLKNWGNGPGFAAAAGLLVYPQYAYREHFEPRRRRAGERGGYFIQVGRWLRESF